MPNVDAPNTHPKDSIIMWSGFLKNIPRGWLICDGTQSTPNLLSRFLRGAPNATGGGGTGGSDTHVLTEAEMESHTHTMTDPTHTHGAGEGSGAKPGGGGSNGENPNSSRSPISAVSGITFNTAGSGDSHENRPTYFECAFIQRSVV